MDYEKIFVLIRVAILPPKLYNVEIGYIVTPAAPNTNTPIKRGTENFWGLTLEQYNHLTLLLAAYQVECSIKVREVT
jgi:hypothetical protein